MSDRLAAFENFCASHLRVENGASFVLEDFQREILADYFSGTRELVVIACKKLGKTSLVAAVALFELVTNPDFKLAIAANSRDQAGRTRDQAAGFIDRSHWLRERVQVTRRQIRSRREDANGEIEILAADTDKIDGWLGDRAFVDELHRADSIELYNVLAAGIVPRGGQILTISTAGDDEEAPLGKIRQAARAMPGYREDGAHKSVRTPGFAFHEWSIAADADREDMAVVKQAHPASWVTEQTLQAAFESPSMVPWVWARFFCGIWELGEDAAVSGPEWRTAARTGLEVPDEASGVVIGIDLARRQDCTAIVAIWPDSDSVTVEPLAIISPPGDGTSITEDEIMEPLVAAAQRWPDATFVADPKFGGDFVTDRIEDGYPRAQVATFDQVPSALASMAQVFTETLAAGRLQHPDDEALNSHVLAAAARSVGETWRFCKSRRTRKPIDGLIALCMALAVALADPEPELSPAIEETPLREITGHSDYVLVAGQKVYGAAGDRYRDRDRDPIPWTRRGR